MEQDIRSRNTSTQPGQTICFWQMYQKQTTAFSLDGAKKTWYSYENGLNRSLSLTCAKINSNGLKTLIGKMKLIKEKSEKNSRHNHSKDFLKMSLLLQGIIPRIGPWDFIKA